MDNISFRINLIQKFIIKFLDTSSIDIELNFEDQYLEYCVYHILNDLIFEWKDLPSQMVIPTQKISC